MKPSRNETPQSREEKELEQTIQAYERALREQLQGRMKGLVEVFGQSARRLIRPLEERDTVLDLSVPRK